MKWSGILLFLASVSYSVGSYGLCSLVLKKTSEWKESLVWSGIYLAMPFGLVTYLYILAWRNALENGMAPWATGVIGVAACCMGTSLAMWLYFNEVPSWGGVVGMTLALTGSVVAIIYK